MKAKKTVPQKVVRAHLKEDIHEAKEFIKDDKKLLSKMKSRAKKK